MRMEVIYTQDGFQLREEEQLSGERKRRVASYITKEDYEALKREEGSIQKVVQTLLEARFCNHPPQTEALDGSPSDEEPSGSLGTSPVWPL